MSETLSNDYWERWASGTFASTPVMRIAPAGLRPARAHWRNVRGPLKAAAIVGVLGAIAWLVPPRAPAELPRRELTQRDAAPCAACPPGERIAAAGVRHANGEMAVTVALEGTPGSVAFEFDGAPSTLRLEPSGSAGEWRATIVRSPGGFEPGRIRLWARESTIVVAIAGRGPLPAAAVRSAAGDRVPAIGFLSARATPPVGFNAIDLLLVVLLAVAARYGYRRGLAIGLFDLAGLGILLAVLVLMWRPTVALLGTPGGSERLALAAGLAAAIVGAGVYLLMSAAARRALARVQRMLDRFVARDLDRPLGLLLGCVRLILVAASLLGIAADIEASDALSNAIATSKTGAVLVEMWRTVV